MRKPRRARLAAAVSLAGALMLLCGCAIAAGQAPPVPPASPGPGEGALRLLGVAGYAEDGGTDPRVDWVTSFEHRTGCRVSYTKAPSAGAVAREFKLNSFDGVVAPPVVARKLISAGMIAPLKVQLIRGYPAISAALRAQAAVRSGGQIYGLPFLWNSYVLGYRTRPVRPVPHGWAALFDSRPAARNGSRIALPDSPLTIALAALYLSSARPALRITDPYELTTRQFAAATGLLRSLRGRTATYYSQDPQVIYDLASGSSALGAVLPWHVGVLARAGRKLAGTDPAGGTTGAADFWLMNTHAQHPNCMYEWLAWSITPWVQRQAAAWNGAEPVTPAACAGSGRRRCRLGHAGDRAYLAKVAFAHMPSPDCGNGRHDCVGWQRWLNAWASLVRAAPG